MKVRKMIGSNFKKITTLCLVLTALSCSDDDDSNIPAEAECIEEYSYDNSLGNGPANWDNFCVSEGTINACASTVRQSPINIENVVDDATLRVLDVAYANTPTEIEYNGNTIEFDYEGSESSFTFNGETFSLLQFHFHSDSEHTVEGEHHPLETHMVHRSAAGNIAVISVFFELGAENEFLANFTANLPSQKDETYEDDNLNYNPGSLVDPFGSYYNYSGSLTTPPCSEIVEWIIMEQPLTVSQTQLDAFSSILKGNYRAVQPLSGRTINYKN